MGSQLSKKSESQTKPQLITTQLKSTSDSNSLSNALDANRRKSSVDSDITPNYITSTSIKPIGSNSLSQTNSVSNWRQQSLSARTQTKTIAIPSEIVVVSEGSATQENQTISFPPLFKPIIPIGYESLSLSYPQINSQYVIDLGLIIEEELRTKAELVAKEQNKLIDRIKDIDLIASHICGQFVNERQRRLNKVFENCSKIEEINCLIEKCENDINKCSKSLEKLNNYLPQSLCLEKFEFN
jgi:hypothetical protein